MNKKPLKKRIIRYLPIYLMALPGLIYLFINNYMPLPGLVLAFKKYSAKKGIFGSKFVGLNNFKYLFATKDAFIITRNTILYNVAFIIINTILAVFVAILVAEMTSKWKKVYQCLILLPYMISMVIVSYLVFGFLSSDNGFINNTILRAMGKEPIQWYMEKKYWPFILIFVNAWKVTGYNCIIYISTILGIDRGIYESAAIDGAGKWMQIRKITIPLLKPTIIMMTLLAVGRIFYSDFGLIFFSLLAVLPMILMLTSSFTDNDVLIAEGYSYFPSKWSAYAYEYIFSTGNSVMRAYLVSIILTMVGTSLALAITTLLAYALSKKDLPGKGILTFLVVFSMLFNGGLVPTYIVYTKIFHLNNTFWALLIPGLLMNGFNVMLMKSYFCSSIPDEILDAAYIDGANEVKTFWKIVIPLSKPILATIALFAGIAYWNDWMNGYIYVTKRTELYSVQNLLNRMMQNIQFLSQSSSNVQNANVGLSSIPLASVRMAMATVGILPIIIVYPFVQKYFVKGITLGGVKG